MKKGLKVWMNIHTYVSMFFLPVAIIYAITGGLLVMTSSHEGSHPGGPPSLSGNATVVHAGQQGLVTEGERHGADPEAGGAHMEMRGAGPAGTASRHADGYAKNEPLHKLTLMHKGKGGLPFNMLGIGFAVAMLTMYVSGICVFWMNSVRRKRMLLVGTAGFVVTFVAIVASL